MSESQQRPRDRRWRRYFRRCRIAVLLGVLGVVGALIYLHLIGLPEFLQRPLLTRLRERGLDLQFSNLRLHFYRGVVAQDVRAGTTGETNRLRFQAREADLNLSWPALLRLQLALSGVVLRDGRLILPLEDAIRTNRVLAVEQLRVHLRFQPDDTWSLDDFHAEFAGANFSLTGVITNASALREWRAPRDPTAAPWPTPAGVVQQRLRRFADALDQIHFKSRPEMRAVLTGDARQVETFTLRLTLSAPDADTPWGKFSSGTLMAKLLPTAPLEQRHAEVQLEARDAQTPWADVADLQLNLRVHSHTTDTNLLLASATLDAGRVLTRWACVTNAYFTAQWLHSLTNAIPVSGAGNFRAEAATSRWATARSLVVDLALETPTNPAAADASWDWWQNLQPFALGWSARAARLDTPQLGADEVRVGGQWLSPLLQLTNVQAAFPEGAVRARARLDVPRREAAFELTSDFDAKRVRPLLTEKAQLWLARYSWQQPPHLSGSGVVILPAWTNRAPDWRNEVGPTLKLAAALAATNCAYLGVPADWVTTHIRYTNKVWYLPDLVAGRPEGRLQLEHVADDNTRAYWFGVRSTISPEALRPVLSTNAQRGLDYFKFTSPPIVEGSVWGRWRDRDSVGFTGRVELADFSFRGESVSRVATSLRYTNQFLEFLEPRVERGAELATASGLAADFPAQRLYLTNAQGTTEPMFIARCIGPKTARTLEPYRFLQPPRATVSGYAPLKDNAADLVFDLAGGPFEWWKFKIPHIAGRVHWQGDSLTLTNIGLQAYDGAAAGYAHFDFQPGGAADFQFLVAVTNTDLRLLMPDLMNRSNPLEGRLSGELFVRQANTREKFTWNGEGRAQLQDGLIWAVPIFGALSKPLDTVLPGLGSARITEGHGQFGITNGVLFSDSLEMRTPLARLQCVGTVDFDARVNMRVTAAPHRSVIGTILTVPMWPLGELFKYQVTGTLSEPKLTPVYIPSLILHPFRTFEEIFTTDAGRTNAPPVFKELP